jgi:hypothetical protein
MWEINFKIKLYYRIELMLLIKMMIELGKIKKNFKQKK